MTTMMEIMKRRYETGDYGGTHFRMPPALWDEIRETMPRPSPPPLFGVASLDALLAIPIVLDEELPAGTWRLVDTLSQDVLFEGDAVERAA